MKLPEADTTISPPAGSLEKESEILAWALTSSFTNLMIIFNTSHFVLLHKLHRIMIDKLEGSYK